MEELIMCLQGKIRIALCCVRLPEGIYLLILLRISKFSMHYSDAQEEV